MLKTKSKYKSYHVSGLLTLILSIFMSSCMDREDYGIKKSDFPELNFNFLVKEQSKVGTRELDSVYITQNYSYPIYIELCCTPLSGVPAEVKEFGTYTVASGYEGKLDPISGSNPLQWYDLESPHTFYGWTVPWNPNYVPSEDPIDVEFKDSANSTGYDENHNNEIMEFLIGTKSDEFSYDTHGKYVDLTFFHLVSKIKIGGLQLTESSGAVERHLKANVTFIGLPTKATLYPHPTSGRPVVNYDLQDVDYDEGVTYYIDNDATGTDMFYICPEVDFSQIDYQVELVNEEYQDYNIYYGTFDAVEFVRTPDTDYDDPENNDFKILHAGEMMTLNINLIPGVGPGLSLIIDKWSTDKPQESTYHTYPGIYSDAEMKQVLDTFLNQGNPSTPTTPQDIQNVFDIYGREDNDTGVKYFPMYDNTTINGDATIPIPNGYVLDGQGHTINLTKTHSGVFGSDPYVNIGPCRDIYISDGKNMIYIDLNGNVWVLDQDTQQYVETGYSLEPLEGNYKSYDIDLTTGEVRQSTYYNNFITN